MDQPRYVTYVSLPGPGEKYGTFSVWGLDRTKFRFEYDGETVKVENGSGFLLDHPDGNTGKPIKLDISSRIKQFEIDLLFLIKEGKIRNFSTTL